MEWLLDHQAEAWLLLALVLGAAEIASADLILLMLAFGSLAGAGSAVAGLNGVLQVVVAGLVSVACLALLRPNLVARLHGGPTLQTGAAALPGKQAVVLEAVGPIDAGRVKVGGEVWSARSAGPVLDPGSLVTIEAVQGATLLVSPRAEPGA